MFCDFSKYQQNDCGQRSFISIVSKSSARIRRDIVAVACWNNGTELSSLLIIKRTIKVFD